MRRFEKRLSREAEKPAAVRNWFGEVSEAVERIQQEIPHAEPATVWAVVTHWITNPDEALLRQLGNPKKRLAIQELLESTPRTKPPLVRLKPRKTDATSEFTFMDLFAGIGGFHLALASQGGTPVFASEWDVAAQLTYGINYGIIPFGDIRRFTRDISGRPLGNTRIANNLPRPDIISAGFPCQPFSRAGVSSRNFHGIDHGLNCTSQGTLFEDIILIARAHKPDALLLENVANLATHDSRRTIGVIRNEIEDCGYQIFPEWNNGKNWAVVDSRAVVGQRRRRVYIVCIRKDLVNPAKPFSFPNFENGTYSLRDTIEKDQTVSDEEKFEQYSISKRMWTSHKRRELGHKSKNNGFRIGLMDDLNKPAPTLVARYYKDGKDCLIPNVDPSQPPRMLTPRECAYLQTFPYNFRLPTSRASAYRQFGNSITVEIAREIATSLVNYLYGNASVISSRN
jgi:DNA (cytosine-5)-methyltransferase 1